MNALVKSAASILDELRIEAPDELDLEAIAAHCGATVLYEPLSGCEARIIGLGDRAIIKVQATSRKGRQRFSIGHELGHWMRDRNRVYFSCTELALQVEWSVDNPERRANRFAADLLLPPRLFRPAARGKAITLETVRDLSRTFATSLIATAIRLVELGSFPAMLVCSDSYGRRKWYIEGPDVHLRPVQHVGKDTGAHDLSHGGSESQGPTDVCSDGWIDHPDAGRFSITEDSIRMRNGLVLSLLWWRDEAQLLALDGEDDGDS